jgi:hypothetical protein
LAAAIVVGKRRDFQVGQSITSHNIPLVLLGAGVLWFGWLGFNAGSALAASPLAVSSFVVTNTAGAAGALVWMILGWVENKKFSALSTATGAVCGLIAITPASGYVGPISSLAIGIIAGLVTYLALRLRSKRLQIDDTLDVWAAHGMGGVTGLLLTGIFAEKAINPAGGNGLLFGNPGQLGIQLLAVLVTVGYSFGMTFFLLKVLTPLGLRVSQREEVEGLDLAEHGEEAYPAFAALDKMEERVALLETQTGAPDTLTGRLGFPLAQESNVSQLPFPAFGAPGTMAAGDFSTGQFKSVPFMSPRRQMVAPGVPTDTRTPRASSLAGMSYESPELFAFSSPSGALTLRIPSAPSARPQSPESPSTEAPRIPLGSQESTQPFLTSSGAAGANPARSFPPDQPGDAARSPRTPSGAGQPQNESLLNRESQSRLTASQVKLRPMLDERSLLSPCGHVKLFQGGFCHICGAPIPS